MRKLFKTLDEVLRAGGDAVLVSVVAGHGATPRGTGARMIVTKDGRIAGTIGGGAVEYRSEQIAAELLEKRTSLTEKFRLRPNDIADLGMICGGDVDVHFRFIPGGDETALRVTERIGKLYRRGEPCWLVLGLENGKLAAWNERAGLCGAELPEEVVAAMSGGETAFQVSAGGSVYYCERVLNPGRVYIFGGGHVAQALVPVLAHVGFRCVVCEDRPDFAAKELFPDAEETRLLDMTDLSALAAGVGPDDYVVIMTRGHQKDYEAQLAMMKTPARYIGVIGSRNKHKQVRQRLLEAGIPEEAFSRVSAPIGLDIGGETPEEIAVSVAAQMIMVRAGKGIGR